MVLSIEPFFGGGGPAGGFYRPPPPPPGKRKPGCPCAANARTFPSSGQAAAQTLGGNVGAFCALCTKLVQDHAQPT